MNNRLYLNPAESTAAGEDEGVTQLPIWRPVVEVLTPEGGHKFEYLGEATPKREAWDIARAAMDNRDEVVSMSVRREGDTRFIFDTQGEIQ